MKKLICFFSLLFLISPTADGQTKSFKISVNQFVEHPALDSVLKGFKDYLSDNKIKIDYNVHNAQGQMATANQIGHQIMGEKPDLILAIATPSSQACAQALKKSPNMKKTPFLFAAVTDPVAAGLVKDPKRPGGNITGVSDMLPMDKHMKMIKEFVPDLKNLGVLYNSGEANSKVTVKLIREEGRRMGFNVIDATVSKSSEVYQAAKSLAGKVEAVFVPTDNTVVSGLESAVKVCTQVKIPLFAADVASVKRGAVAAMGFDYYKHGRQTGAMALRIFKGASPREMPVETQKELQLHINIKYAKLMGANVPEDLLKKADKVYE
jgi:putative ABC transport system substrate-binding protein